MITERNGRLCEWRDLSQRSRAEAENKAAESAGEKASVRGKYRRPDLNRSEWNLLNRRLEEEIESSGQYLDESTKWLYADEKGVQVFALYGIGGGTEATPLYAVGGKQAAAYNAAMTKYLEGKEHADESAVDFDGWIKSHRSAGMDQSRSVLHGGQRGSDGHADGGVYRGSSERTGGSVSERSSKDQRRVKKKFSLRDSAGRELTAAQQDYFKDSKVRDAAGRLKVMYRGGNGDFTVFDRRKSKYSNLYGRGFYFTDSESHAKQYGNARAFYLNITNPVSTTETSITRAQLRKFLEAVAGNEDDLSFENYGYGATVDSVLKSTYGKSDFFMLYDVSQTAIGDMVQAVELFNEVNGTNYDGLILDTETVAFHSNQIKNTDNKTPSSDPDIRYSLRGKYWRPQLRDAEWTLLNRKLDEGIESSEQYLDESMKWLYADEKGVQVFALYGIGDGTEATPLYAVGGEQARYAASLMRDVIEEVGRSDGNAEGFDSWAENLRSKNGNYRRNYAQAGDGKPAGRNAGLHGRSQGRNTGGTSGRSTKDQRRVKEKFSLREPVEQTRDLVAVHNLTEQNLRDAFYLGGLPMPSIAVVKAALEKLPVYRGTVYRHYDFDSFGGYEAMAEFLSQFAKGRAVPMSSYLSASTVRNEDRTNGEYTVDMVIQSETGRSLNGFGRDTENEVLLSRTTELIADSMELISPHKVRITAREVVKNGTGTAADSASVGVRDVRESEQRTDGLRQVSGRNPGGVQTESGRSAGRDGDAGLSGLREGTRSGSLGEPGVESDYRAAEEGLKYQPREQSVSDRQRSRYCQRTEFELLFARGRGRIDTYRHKRRTDHGRKEKANFQRDSALRGADARLIYGRD